MNASAYELIDQFRDKILATGLVPPDAIEPGKWMRFPGLGKGNGNTAGWCKLFDDCLGGVFGDHSSGLSETWQAKRDKPYTATEYATFKRQVAESNARRDAERAQAAKHAQSAAVQAWNDASTDTNGHVYLSNKQVGAHGTRVADGVLLVPMRDTEGNLRSLQRIYPDGTKRYLKNGNIPGHYFSMGKPSERAYITEGFATGASVHEATGEAVAVAFDCGNLVPVATAIHKKHPNLNIVIAADNDQFTDGNPGVTKATEAAKAVGGALAIPVFADIATKPTDFNDLAILEGLEAVRRQLRNTKSVEPDTGGVIAKLAALSPVDYDQCREQQAKSLNIRVATIDKEVARLRAESAGDNQQGSAVIFHTPDPWSESVNGAALLDDIADMFARYMVLPKGAADIAALWCAHAHAFDIFEHTPRLNITSPEKQCGKTVLLDLLSLVTPKALRTENVTTAVLFRLVHRDSPTLLVDEYDTFLNNTGTGHGRGNEDLRGALNAGHRRGGQHLRCEGDKNEVRAFRTFAPVALAGIRALPGTLHDRSIVISLTRAKPGEINEVFDSRKTAAQDDLNRKLARWTHDRRDELASIDPAMPIHNRQADNWRPLFAIAEVASGVWPEKVRSALAVSAGENQDDTPAVMVLEDIQRIFEDLQNTPPATGDPGHISSADLVAQLADLEDRPWPEWRRGKPITVRQLARLLAPFSIKPRTIRVGVTTAKGYTRDAFKDSFDRFLSDPPNRSVTPSQVNIGAGFSEFPSVTPENHVTDRNRPKPAPVKECDGVTDQFGGFGHDAEMEVMEL